VRHIFVQTKTNTYGYMAPVGFGSDDVCVVLRLSGVASYAAHGTRK